VPLDQLPANQSIGYMSWRQAWTRALGEGPKERAGGHVFATRGRWLDKTVGANFEGLPVVEAAAPTISELGVNALELLPPADSFFKREWGYDTRTSSRPIMTWLSGRQLLIHRECGHRGRWCSGHRAGIRFSWTW